MSKVEQERLEADKIKYALVSQRKAVEDELNKRDEYHMPDQEVGQTMSKKYELLTARYRSVSTPPLCDPTRQCSLTKMLYLCNSYKPERLSIRWAAQEQQGCGVSLMLLSH